MSAGATNKYQLHGLFKTNCAVGWGMFALMSAKNDKE
jgi:hypothetical protein